MSLHFTIALTSGQEPLCGAGQPPGQSRLGVLESLDLMEVSVIKLGDVLASAVSCGDNGCLPEFKGVDEKRLASGKDRRRGNPDSQPAFVLNDDANLVILEKIITDFTQCAWSTH